MSEKKPTMIDLLYKYYRQEEMTLSELNRLSTKLDDIRTQVNSEYWERVFTIEKNR